MIAPAQLPMHAGILCNDVDYRRFVGERTIGKGYMVTPRAATQYLYEFCNITSRSQLPTNPDAARRFDTLRLEFDTWRGKAGAPR